MHHARVAKWQTHYLEVVAPKGVEVRLLSRALQTIKPAIGRLYCLVECERRRTTELEFSVENSSESVPRARERDGGDVYF